MLVIVDPWVGFCLTVQVLVGLGCSQGQHVDYRPPKAGRGTTVKGLAAVGLLAC